jgi:hypothetical protein
MSKKFYRKRLKKALLLFSVLVALAAVAQDRRSELDKAFEEARAAYQALKDAEARRDQDMEPQNGERQGPASGGTRPTDRYAGRQ